MATVQLSQTLVDEAVFSETRLLLETADLERHELALPAGRYETASELVSALDAQMAATLPFGEARLDEAHKLTLFSTTPFRLARLAPADEAARFGALPAHLGLDVAVERSFERLLTAKATPANLLALAAIAKLEPKGQRASGTQAQGRSGALRTRSFGAWLTSELVLDFIHERDWPKLMRLLKAFNSGDAWMLADGHGRLWRLHKADEDVAPTLTRPYAQAPYLRVTMSVRTEEP